MLTISIILIISIYYYRVYKVRTNISYYLSYKKFFNIIPHIFNLYTKDKFSYNTLHIEGQFTFFKNEGYENESILLAGYTIGNFWRKQQIALYAKIIDDSVIFYVANSKKATKNLSIIRLCDIMCFEETYHIDFKYNILTSSRAHYIIDTSIYNEFGERTPIEIPHKLKMYDIGYLKIGRFKNQNMAISIRLWR